jgi:hypothetical protein
MLLTERFPFSVETGLLGGRHERGRRRRCRGFVECGRKGILALISTVDLSAERIDTSKGR